MPEPHRADTPLATGTATLLFTDIEASTRLWEQEGERMSRALAQHDALSRSAVESHRGAIVKMTGDGMYAVFGDPLDAVNATVALQQVLNDPSATNGIAFRLRYGLHLGVVERRNEDLFGSPVNRAARIMKAAHGGQILLSQAVVDYVRERLPPSVSLRDLGAVRLRDLATSEHVYQLLHPQLRQDFPALRSLEATPNNLPLQLTSFIGREKEVGDVEKLLDGNRLVTLLGVGGIGKTRLSLQSAADVMDHYPDGVWFVELAPVTDGALVPQTVASVLGVKEEAGRPVIEALVKYVKDRRPLIILDNCEHLVRPCAELAKQLLQSGRHLKILASSREALHVAGEAVYSVPALAAPDPYQKFMHRTLTQYAAARLFVERAVAAQPAFALSEQNAMTVADVCHRLDGIPLAIELAAARARAMSVEEIAARLTDRFRLLARGDRTALPRQQTLRALIDWSYDLLTEPERALFRRLAVFAGGWALDAAEAVAAGRGVEAEGVVDLLANLVEKSLVVLDPRDGRYRLLETVRQYARERLAESGEEHAVRARHLDFYLTLAEKAKPELMGPQQGAWLARLDLERENVFAAHTACDRVEGGAESGLRLAFAMTLYLVNRGLLGFGQRMATEALGRTGAGERTLPRCRALHMAGQLSIFAGRYRQAQEFLDEALSIARELGDKGRVQRALLALGEAFLGQGELTTARARLEEALALARELGNKRELAVVLNELAQLYRVEGSPTLAKPLYDQALSLARELNDRESIAIALLNLAMVAIARDLGDRAREMLKEAAAIAVEIRSRPVGQSLLEVSAGLAVWRGENELAARFFGAAAIQMEETGLFRHPADQMFLAPLIAKAPQALGAAAFATAEAAGHSLSYEAAIREARAWIEKPS